MSDSTGLGPAAAVIGFYQYDEALQKFLTLDIYPDPNDPDEKKKTTIIPIAGPPRAEYATQEKIDGIPKDTIEPDRLNQTIKLPAMALSRLDFVFKPERWTKAKYRKLAMSEDGRRVIQSDEPMPFDVMYQLDIWTKYRSQMNQIIRKLALKFMAREIWLPVNLGGPWGSRSIPIQWMEGPKDLTDLDHGSHGKMERKIRNVVTLVMRAWIMPDPTSIPTVRDVTYTYYLQEQGPLTWPTEGETIPLSSWSMIKQVIVESDVGENPENENP